MSKPPKRIPEGYGTRSLAVLRESVKRGLRLEGDSVVLPSGRKTKGTMGTGKYAYHSIHIGANGKHCKVTRARVVCYLAHGEPPAPHYVADHINGDPHDDRPENLRWATYADNVCNNAATRSGGISPQRVQACIDALAGIPDPAAYIKAMREAIGTMRKVVELIRHVETATARGGHRLDEATRLLDDVLALDSLRTLSTPESEVKRSKA